MNSHRIFLVKPRQNVKMCKISKDVFLDVLLIRMLELTTIWKDRAIPNKLKVKLIEILIWTVMMYGAQGWTLRKSDEKKIRGADMWLYRRLLWVHWTQKRTNRSILEKLGEKDNYCN